MYMDSNYANYLYRFMHLSSGGVWHINPVLGPCLLVPALGGHVDVDPEPVAVVGELVDDERVLVQHVDLPRHLVLRVGQVADEGHLHLAASLLGRGAAQGQDTGHLGVGSYQLDQQENICYLTRKYLSMLVLVVTVTAPLFPPRLVCPVVLNRDRVSPATEIGLI